MTAVQWDGKYTMKNSKKKKRRKKRKIGFFIFEVIILILLLGGLFVYAKVNDGFRNIGSGTLFSSVNSNSNSSDPNQNTDNVVINEEAAVDKVMSGYTNILLVGIDARSANDFNYSNSDTMIVCSINNNNGEVRLVSIYRDTLLNTNPSTDNYTKANDAYMQGSITQCLSMINTNLDLSITQYMVVDFTALSTLVDDIGGIDITLSEEETVHVNNYCKETSQVTGKSYEDLPKEAGTYTLNGVQAVSYSRIRYTKGYDMKRTQRQRLVIKKIVEKARSQGLSAISSVINDVFPLCKTNISNSMLIKMATQMIGYYQIVDTTGFPFYYKSGSSSINSECLVPITLETNVTELHEFLFDDSTYLPSSTVKSYSQTMEDLSGFTIADLDTATSSSNIAAAGSESDSIR